MKHLLHSIQCHPHTLKQSENLVYNNVFQVSQNAREHVVNKFQIKKENPIKGTTMVG